VYCTNIDRKVRAPQPLRGSPLHSRGGSLQGRTSPQGARHPPGRDKAALQEDVGEPQMGQGHCQRPLTVPLLSLPPPACGPLPSQVAQVDVKHFFEFLCGEVSPDPTLCSWAPKPSPSPSPCPLPPLPFPQETAGTGPWLPCKPNPSSRLGLCLQHARAWQVSKLRLLGTTRHNTRIAFVEFYMVSLLPHPPPSSTPLVFTACHF